MEAGIEINDALGNRILGMDDFTYERLAAFIVEPRSGSGNGVRSDGLDYTIPGYDPDTCFVVITPLVYATYEQGASDTWRTVPYFTNLGGEGIRIITYVNYGSYDFQGDLRYYWRETNVRSIVEVLRIL